MNDKCLFCQIANGAIPAQKVFENEQVIAFIDIYPQAKLHLLFIHQIYLMKIKPFLY